MVDMEFINVKIAEHLVRITSDSANLIDIIKQNDYSVVDELENHNILINIKDGYGSPFEDYEVTITKENGKVIFRRSDYLIEVDPDYKSAFIFVNNALALKHALMNLFSSYIVYHNWGLLIHSSCVIEDRKAHIFAGHSGAGKSTAARLSQPRDLLSDEATLVKITTDEIIVFDSPFRSEISSRGSIENTTLESIQILHQAHQNKRVNLKKSDALVHLMDKVFYWAHNPEETKKIMGLLRMLVGTVPVYDLYFKKDDTFWELIS
jgi:hypothetical protein